MRHLSAVAAAVVLFASAPVVQGHQLDECLQAAKVSIARDRISIDLALTPGVLAAPAILDGIDHDRDGRLSPLEIRDYAALVARDVVVRVDETPLRVTLVQADAASYEELSEGVGTIRVRVEAVIPRLGGGAHRIAFANNHTGTPSVYLVNALVPDDPAITIGAQRRDRLQHAIDLDVEIASAGYPLAMLAIVASALAGRAGSAAFRRRRQAASAHRH